MSWDLVYKLVKKIPRGRVTTYGALAKALRLRGGARAAGYAMAACPSGKGIPWHRVIGAGGRLLIQEPHSSLQRRLLESEGITIDGKRVNMKLFAWAPVRERGNAKGKSRARARIRRRAKSR
jgi:methylated-DNA-protein-cysteine methyltransferase-like protein